MHWHKQLQRLGSDDILFGLDAIARYLGVSRITLWRMRKEHDLPIVSLDFHRTFASKKLLDNWMLSAAQASVDKARAMSALKRA